MVERCQASQPSRERPFLAGGSKKPLVRKADFTATSYKRNVKRQTYYY